MLICLISVRLKVLLSLIFFCKFAIQLIYTKMSKNKSCIVCKSTDQIVPLIQFKFKGEKYYICSQHVPVLIHKAHELESLLPGIPPSE